MLERDAVRLGVRLLDADADGEPDTAESALPRARRIEMGNASLDAEPERTGASGEGFLAGEPGGGVLLSLREMRVRNPFMLARSLRFEASLVVKSVW